MYSKPWNNAGILERIYLLPFQEHARLNMGHVQSNHHASVQASRSWPSRANAFASHAGVGPIWPRSWSLRISPPCPAIPTLVRRCTSSQTGATDTLLKRLRRQGRWRAVVSRPLAGQEQGYRIRTRRTEDIVRSSMTKSRDSGLVAATWRAPAGRLLSQRGGETLVACKFVDCADRAHSATCTPPDGFSSPDSGITT